MILQGKVEKSKSGILSMPKMPENRECWRELDKKGE